MTLRALPQRAGRRRSHRLCRRMRTPRIGLPSLLGRRRSTQCGPLAMPILDWRKSCKTKLDSGGDQSAGASRGAARALMTLPPSAPPAAGGNAEAAEVAMPKVLQNELVQVPSICLGLASASHRPFGPQANDGCIDTLYSATAVSSIWSSRPAGFGGHQDVSHADAHAGLGFRGDGQPGPAWR